MPVLRLALQLPLLVPVPPDELLLDELLLDELLLVPPELLELLLELLELLLDEPGRWRTRSSATVAVATPVAAVEFDADESSPLQAAKASSVVVATSTFEIAVEIGRIVIPRGTVSRGGH